MNNAIKAMMMGIPTKESEDLKRRMGIEPSNNNMVLESANDIDLNSITKNGEKPTVLKNDIRLAMATGQMKSADIRNQYGNDLYVDTGKKTVDEYLGKMKASVNESSNPTQNSHTNVTKEEIEGIVYETLSEILGISKSKMTDKEYVSSFFADAVAFIKLRESMGKK